MTGCWWYFFTSYVRLSYFATLACSTIMPIVSPCMFGISRCFNSTLEAPRNSFQRCLWVVVLSSLSLRVATLPISRCLRRVGHPSIA